MTTIGIDPGKSGAIAWTHEDGPRVEKMPDTVLGVWDLFCHIVDDSAIIYRHGEFKAYIEQVHSSPQMGVTSAFTFGNGFGHLEMALTAAGIPFERIRPQVWQKALGCLTKGDKNVSKRRAQELFPQMKVTHSTADALLIAEYGKRNNK